eukprot:CAMPEP_0174244672 /NCGR_PEP_ID=MMETSP0417-20130205/36138_1 /TAXON_ID=242541 /ORGANISM="Mayorella sp, Strain BSH-02190019" /LENGTH=307 /DNA_ID=CAMNT_0015324381 /DNA_START=145 /DNA_END=1068 /DNA_ORIENTATION=+
MTNVCGFECATDAMSDKDALFWEVSKFNVGANYNMCASAEFGTEPPPQLQLQIVVPAGEGALVQLLGDCTLVTTMNYSEPTSAAPGPSMRYTRNIAPNTTLVSQEYVTLVRPVGDATIDVAFAQLNTQVAAFPRKQLLTYSFGTKSSQYYSNGLSALYYVLEDGSDPLDITLTVWQRSSASQCASQRWVLYTGTEEQVLGAVGVPASQQQVLPLSADNTTLILTLIPLNDSTSAETWFRIETDCFLDSVQAVMVTHVTSSSESGSSGWVWWMYMLIALGVVLVIGVVGVAVAFLMHQVRSRKEYDTL